MLGDRALRQVSTPRGHSSASLKPPGNVLFDPFIQGPRGAAHVRATARTLEIIDNATPLVRRGRVFERTLRNPPALPNDLGLNEKIRFRNRLFNEFVVFVGQLVTKERKLEKNFLLIRPEGSKFGRLTVTINKIGGIAIFIKNSL